MKRVLFLLLLTSACTSYKPDVRKSISLAGEWKFRIDSLDVGLNEQWYNNIFDDAVKLPGSMAENGKGYDVTLTTEWTGDIIDKSYFKSDKYQKYQATLKY